MKVYPLTKLAFREESTFHTLSTRNTPLAHAINCHPCIEHTRKADLTSHFTISL